jgi:hypothetical protein
MGVQYNASSNTGNIAGKVPFSAYSGAISTASDANNKINYTDKIP